MVRCNAPYKTSDPHENAMFAPGPLELLILLIVFGGAVAGIGVMIFFAVRAPRNPGPPPGDPRANPNLVQCFACGGYVSRQATACPHCGQPVDPSAANG